MAEPEMAVAETEKTESRFPRQCATFVGNSYQTFGLATDKTYQTELNLTGPNKNNDFLYNKC